jgi:hypothetical protein
VEELVIKPRFLDAEQEGIDNKQTKSAPAN